jgi:hypothetical protein
MRAARSFEVHSRRRSSFARGVCEAMGLPLGFPERLRPAFARSVMWFDFADAHYEHNTQKEKGRPRGRPWLIVPGPPKALRGTGDTRRTRTSPPPGARRSSRMKSVAQDGSVSADRVTAQLQEAPSVHLPCSSNS